LNADVGELDDDAPLVALMSSVSIACGLHAGHPERIRRSLLAAKAAGVAVGAHPSFPDREGFGRREMSLPPDVVESLVTEQVGVVAELARAEGLELRHVKPHGALYNMASREAGLARAIVRAVKDSRPPLMLYALAGCELLKAGQDAGLSVAAEAFADRAYEPNGALTPRGTIGAVITDVGVVVDRAWRLVSDGRVTARDGSTLTVRADTICIHGDTPGAADLAREVRQALEARGVRIAPPSAGPHGKG
jgi:5-oxoprolinase (ATP-hydrolysing) subunit A